MNHVLETFNYKYKCASHFLPRKRRHGFFHTSRAVIIGISPFRICLGACATEVYFKNDSTHALLNETCLVIVCRTYIVPVIPPLSEIHCAVIHRLFSDASRSTASAMSAVVPRRAAARVIACIAICISVGDPSGFSRNGFDVSVGTGPGAIALTVIPRLFPSCKLL